MLALSSSYDLIAQSETEIEVCYKQEYLLETLDPSTSEEIEIFAGSNYNESKEYLNDDKDATINSASEVLSLAIDFGSLVFQMKGPLNKTSHPVVDLQWISPARFESLNASIFETSPPNVIP
ncbi:hypothetical protein SSS_04406 [Sarcoptes scabiei]|uniref:Uncharacterized protein n=1 Tax=Sarcoptes scabiei TaxID=52283 RepID=A0A834RE42_SARSC|nr:hypothetical protein SSS_04406 [Sarcoptes scabiei]